MYRVDRREPIFRDEQDRQWFLATLGEACAKTGWHMHALCLKASHFHLVLETPQADLVKAQTAEGACDQRRGDAGVAQTLQTVG
jgi:REP element-mobilizing transposase RayT